MNFLDSIKEKIKEKLNPDHLLLINNSHLHSKHKSFDINKFHLKLKKGTFFRKDISNSTIIK